MVVARTCFQFQTWSPRQCCGIGAKNNIRASLPVIQSSIAGDKMGRFSLLVQDEHQVKGVGW